MCSVIVVDGALERCKNSGVSDDIGDLLELVVAEGAVGEKEAEGAVGVDAFEGGCEVALGITIAGGDAEAVETTDV